MSTATALWVSLLLLLGNAFFVGGEFAVISARRSQVEPLAEQTGIESLAKVDLRVGKIVACERVLKADKLAQYKSPVALGLMRAIKQALDPQGLMNPGCILQK